MKRSGRVPAWTDVSLSGAGLWFKAMLRANLLYHPDDDPIDVVSLQTGRRPFHRAEGIELREIIKDMCSAHGDSVYEVALPVFHEALGVWPDC